MACGFLRCLLVSLSIIVSNFGCQTRAFAGLGDYKLLEFNCSGGEKLQSNDVLINYPFNILILGNENEVGAEMSKLAASILWNTPDLNRPGKCIKMPEDDIRRNEIYAARGNDQLRVVLMDIDEFLHLSKKEYDVDYFILNITTVCYVVNKMLICHV